MSISEKDKINLNDMINEFVNMVSNDSEDISTDPNVKRVKVIRVDEYDCPGCNMDELFKKE